MKTTIPALWVLAALALPVRADEPKPLVRIPIGDGKPKLLDINRMEFTPAGGHIVVRRILQSPDLARFGSEGAIIEVFDATTAKRVADARIAGGSRFSGGFSYPGFAISPKSDWVAYGRSGGIGFLTIPPHQPTLPKGTWNSATSSSPQALWAVRDETNFFLAFERDGRYWLRRAELSGESAKLAAILEGGEDPGPFGGGSIPFGLRGDRFAAVVGTPDGKCRIDCWVLGEKPKRTAVPLDSEPPAAALSPDGKVVAVGSSRGTVHWYDTETGKPLGRTPALTPKQKVVVALAFHPDGKFLAAGTADNRGMKNLFLVNVAKGEVVTGFSADDNGVSQVCFSPTGARLASFGGASEIRIWDVTALLKLERN